MENIDLKYIKKHYGENFAKMCRSFFSTILEQEGVLVRIIKDHFVPSRSLYEDIKSDPDIEDAFKAYVFGFIDTQNRVVKENKGISAVELLNKVGYILYPECESEEDIQSFKKYYEPHEALCTFWGHRLDSCRVWFAVKKDVDQIKRKDFRNPRRQDKYGTSVLSIQFTKGYKSIISIKNRYNHTVENPDATFSNNLDNIIPGLTEAFCEDYSINLINGQGFLEIPGYVMATDKKFYRRNIEHDNVCYCENNVVIDKGKAVTYDKSKYILFDRYLIDISLKDKIFTEDNPFNGLKLAYPGFGESDEKDAFINSIGRIKKINIEIKENGERDLLFIPFEGEEIRVGIDKHNEIVSYLNANVTEIGDYFLSSNRRLKNFYAPNLNKIGDGFLEFNKDLKTFDAHNVREIGNNCLYANTVVSSADFTSLEKVGDNFFFFNEDLTNLDFPKLKEVGNAFFRNASDIRQIHTPNLEKSGFDFLYQYEEMAKVPKEEKDEYGFFF